MKESIVEWLRHKTINEAACLIDMMATLKTFDCKTLNLMIHILERH